MTDSKGTRLPNPLNIANCFRKFYANLYNLETAGSDDLPTDQTIHSFLSKVNFPTLTTDQIVTLSQPFTPHEIDKILCTLTLHKASGPDRSEMNIIKNFGISLPRTSATHLITFSQLVKSPKNP